MHFMKPVSITRLMKHPLAPLWLLLLMVKGVVMHQQDLREATRKAADKRKNQMETRLSQGEKKSQKRMATVAAVYTIDEF